MLALLNILVEAPEEDWRYALCYRSQTHMVGLLDACSTLEAETANYTSNIWKSIYDHICPHCACIAINFGEHSTNSKTPLKLILEYFVLHQLTHAEHLTNSF
jgi:hypothetical protein